MSVPKDVKIAAMPIEPDALSAAIKKKRIAVAAGAAVLLALIGGGAWYMMQPAQPEVALSAGAGNATYIEVPAITVNLRGDDGQARFLKLRFIIVAANASKVNRINERMPVVLDALQPFLRELRPEDMAGAAAVFRIKEEMMARCTQALGVGVVSDVLIQELIQQ